MAIRRLPPLTALRAFEAVARHASFKNAADELCVTPGALSQQVRKLEDDLGVELLIRHNRSIEVTPRGQALCDGLSDAFLCMRDAVASARPELQPDCLVVGCPSPFAMKWLVPRLGHFTEAHPDVDIRIAADYRSATAEPVDVTIRLSEARTGELGSERLARESFLPLVSPSFLERYNIRTPEDFLRVPLIREASGDLFGEAPRWEDWFRACGIDAPADCRVIDFGDRIDQAIDAAASGVGALLGPRVLSDMDLASGRLVSPCGPEITAPVHYEVACARRPGRPRLVDAFREWLNTEFVPMAQPAAPQLRAVNA